MGKKQGFLLCYLIIPVCFFIAVIIVGLIRKHSFISIYNDSCCFANKLRKIFIQSAKKKRRLKGF